MKRLRVIPILLTLATLVLLALAGGVLSDTLAQDATEEAVATPTRPVHRDSGLLVESVLETTRAFLSEDAVRTRAALDSVKENTPPLHPDDDAAYGRDLLNLDRAFHVTIDLSREYVTTGRLAAGFDQFVWVQRACVKCHGMARESGLMAEAPIPDPRED